MSFEAREDVMRFSLPATVAPVSTVADPAIARETRLSSAVHATFGLDHPIPDVRPHVVLSALV